VATFEMIGCAGRLKKKNAVRVRVRADGMTLDDEKDFMYPRILK